MRQWKKNYNFVISSLTICDRLFTMYSNYVTQTENMDFFFVSSFLCQPPFAKRVYLLFFPLSYFLFLGYTIIQN